ncbi:Lrp/AsnC family transcriptional regulator [Plantibacter sp. CFBP 8804]|uniref:Lrp/AsnC family transcriptional regulator n=1 Tax=Plantibacter sp. CFBP 8804 TaxID=2775270 RepID=UPI00177CDBF6|nr:Lrp/AsnC family transcriptional regulator [Plantibacter sp. CFBP 8804]MBD8518499.1 Lrp/AsnC family transcriptional regulator [Plantibacter sp. CFBP 8804]
MPHPATIDHLDARILTALDDDPSMTALALARTLGVARNTVHARLRRLETSGALGAPSRRVRLSALGYPLTAFIEISIRQDLATEAYAALESTPEIVEVHATTGDADLFAKVVAHDTEDLHRIAGVLLAAPGVVRTNTKVSLIEVIPYRSSSLLDRLAEEPSAR